MTTRAVLVTGIGGNVGQGVLRNIGASFPELRLVGTDIGTVTACMRRGCDICALSSTRQHVWQQHGDICAISVRGLPMTKRKA